MKAGHVIKRLSWVSVIIAVVSLPRSLAGLFPLHSSDVAGDPVIEAAERLSSAPTKREPAISAPRADYEGFLRSVTTAGSDLTEREHAEQHLQRLRDAQAEREAAAYEQSLQPTD